MCIVDIAFIIKENCEKFKFGMYVYESIVEFNTKYNDKILGISNFDDFTENQKAIVSVLKEYGISLKSEKIDLSFIKEIEEQLNIRYSTYDIINAIKYLAQESKRNKSKFVSVKNKYID